MTLQFGRFLIFFIFKTSQVQLSGFIMIDMMVLTQRFSNHASRSKCESPRLCGWVVKACKLPHMKEKDLRTQDFKSEDSFLRDHYDFKTKIQKSESDSR